MCAPAETYATVIYRHGRYHLIARECATRWDMCPHGDKAVTIRRLGKSSGWEMCVSVDELTYPEEGDE